MLATSRRTINTDEIAPAKGREHPGCPCPRQDHRDSQVPKYIDDPPLILLWRVDDLVPIVLCLVIGIFTGSPGTLFKLIRLTVPGYRGKGASGVGPDSGKSASLPGTAGEGNGSTLGWWDGTRFLPLPRRGTGGGDALDAAAVKALY